MHYLLDINEMILFTFPCLPTNY